MYTGEITAGDIMHELDFAIGQTRNERLQVIAGNVEMPTYPAYCEYMTFLTHTEKAFNAMRRYLRSEEFLNKIASRKSGGINTNER